jgi:hypothetical protein
MLKKIVLFLMCVAVMVPACGKPIAVRVSEPVKTIAQGQFKSSLDPELVQLKEKIAKLQLGELESRNSWLFSVNNLIIRGIFRVVEVVTPIITVYCLLQIKDKVH